MASFDAYSDRKGMAMGKISISLDEKTELWMQEQIKGGEYDDASAYVSDIIRRDHENKQKFAVLKQAIQDGLNSGFSEKTIDDAWDETLNELGPKHG